jgi:hypothetical protein
MIKAPCVSDTPPSSLIEIAESVLLEQLVKYK